MHDGNYHLPACLEDLFDRETWYRGGGTIRDAETRAAAISALSDACVRYGRGLAWLRAKGF